MTNCSSSTIGKLKLCSAGSKKKKLGKCFENTMIRELFALYTVYCAHLAWLKPCNLVTDLNASASKFWPVLKTATWNKQSDPFRIAFASVRRSECFLSIVESRSCTILFISTTVWQSANQIIADRGLTSPVMHFVYLQLACVMREGYRFFHNLTTLLTVIVNVCKSIRKSTLPIVMTINSAKETFYSRFFMFYTEQSHFVYSHLVKK